MRGTLGLALANQFEAMITIGKAMEELLHLNHNQEFSYSREQLIAMMDEEWAILKGEKNGIGAPKTRDISAVNQLVRIRETPLIWLK